MTTIDAKAPHKQNEILYFALRNNKLRIGLAILLFFLLLTFVGPLLTDYDPNAYVNPMGAQPPSSEYWLGTTTFGQDVFTQSVYGLQATFFVGIVAGGLQAPAYFLVLTYLVHTFGELCLSPVGLSTVTKLAPARFVGQMMGVWFLASSLGKLTAGLIAGGFDPDDLAGMPGRYFNIVLYGCGVGLLLLVVSGRVTRMMGGVK